MSFFLAVDFIYSFSIYNPNEDTYRFLKVETSLEKSWG